VGVSIYAPSELEMITKLFRLDLVQAPFNLVDRRLLATGWLQRLTNEGIEIHTRSAFLQGLLLMPQSAIPPKFAPWNDLWIRWQQWLKDHRVSAVQACLDYPLTFTEISRVVVGADSVNQLEQIMVAANQAPQAGSPDLQCADENLINPSQWAVL